MNQDSSSNGTAPGKSVNETNAEKAFATLGRFLEEDGWFPQRLEEKKIYRMFFRGKHGEYRCYAQIREDLEQFLFYVVGGVKAQEDVRQTVAEFITRANFGLRIGNFELDFSDGEVRYKSSLDFEGQLLTPTLIHNAIYPAVNTMDKYFPGLMKVMYGAATAVTAIAGIED